MTIRLLLFSALGSVALGAEDPSRIVSISEVGWLTVPETATVRFSDEHGAEWRLRLSKNVSRKWSVAFGRIPQEADEMAPVVEQSGTYRKTLLVMLTDFRGHADKSDGLSPHLLPALKALADEILQEPNPPPPPTRKRRPGG